MLACARVCACVCAGPAQHLETPPACVPTASCLPNTVSCFLPMKSLCFGWGSTRVCPAIRTLLHPPPPLFSPLAPHPSNFVFLSLGAPAFTHGSCPFSGISALCTVYPPSLVKPTSSKQRSCRAPSKNDADVDNHYLLAAWLRNRHAWPSLGLSKIANTHTQTFPSLCLQARALEASSACTAAAQGLRRCARALQQQPPCVLQSARVAFNKPCMASPATAAAA